MRKFESLKWIYKYSKKNIWAVAFLSIISTLIALGFIGLALISKQVIDIITGKHEGKVLYYCILFIVIIALQAILNIINSNIRIRASSRIEMNMKEGIFSLLLKKQLIEINKYHSGEYINRLTSDIGIIVDAVITILPKVISMIVKIIAGLIVLININPEFVFILIPCGFIVFYSSWIFRKKFKELHKEVQQTDGKTRSFMQECIENLVIIKSFSSNPILTRLNELQKYNYFAKLKRNKISNFASTGAYVVFASGYYLILIWGALQVAENKMTFGSLTAFLQIFEQLKEPLSNISGFIPQYFSMLASAERLIELENIKNELADEISVDIEEIYKNLECIEFNNVSFTYDKEPILNGFSVIINKGELTSIIGSSGVGKSTIIKLILGLMEVNRGSVNLKTKDTIYRIDSSIRKLFSYVPQGNMIFSGTIGENIAFFNNEIIEEDIVKAIEIACLKDLISEMPSGLNTIIGERGIGLSEGQVQRIAIARALTSKAPIILLDEATSALDIITEKKLLSNLKSIEYKTFIFVSHREGTIEESDKLIKIEKYTK